MDAQELRTITAAANQKQLQEKKQKEAADQQTVNHRVAFIVNDVKQRAPNIMKFAAEQGNSSVTIWSAIEDNELEARINVLASKRLCDLFSRYGFRAEVQRDREFRGSDESPRTPLTSVVVSWEKIASPKKGVRP